MSNNNMGHFPGLVEVTCPCCLRYKHVREVELHKLNDKCPDDNHPTGVLCGSCYKVFKKMQEKLKCQHSV